MGPRLSSQYDYADIDDGDGDGPLTPIRGLISASATANTEVESEQSAASTLADNAILKRIRPTIQFHDARSEGSYRRFRNIRQAYRR